VVAGDSEFGHLAMFPALVVMYARLAKAKEREAIAELGAEYERYMSEVPAFIPKFGSKRSRSGQGQI
jgi:methanethiol S-methyltransferase